MANMSEDALFKALLKNKPPQQPPKPPVVQSQNIPRREAPGPFPAAQPAERYQHEEPQPQIERITPAAKPVNLEPVVDSINRLNSGVIMIYRLMKNVIAPVLILTLVISIAIFIKSR